MVRMTSPTQMSAAGVSLEANTDAEQLSPELFMVQQSKRDPERELRTFMRVATVTRRWDGLCERTTADQNQNFSQIKAQASIRASGRGRCQGP